MNNPHTEYDTLSGAICLSFANAFNVTASDGHEEMFQDYADLIEWAQLLEVIDLPTAQSLHREAEQHPGEATAVLQSAWALRQVLYRLFAALAHQQTPDPADLDALNTALVGTLAHQRLVLHEDGFAWVWDNTAALDQMIWPVLRDAADLLTGDLLDRVGQCANVRGCGWLFLDTSRNRSRRWCSMETCGNRAKVMRHYRRTKA
ncbi:MAG: ABATE domain-containing protein [Anaerolineaceae bacterium]|nr:ABATE domain-containing protein [Anaerolineaceae bacterium]